MAKISLNKMSGNANSQLCPEMQIHNLVDTRNYAIYSSALKKSYTELTFVVHCCRNVYKYFDLMFCSNKCVAFCGSY